MFANNLYRSHAKGALCKAFGIKLSANPGPVQTAQQAGFDSLFIDLEHSTLSIGEASQLCTTGLLAGVTPFVRVPYECGDGFVQRVLDGGAMGVIFPHVSNRAQAEKAVSISKYPPWGKRSMTGQLPQFSMASHPAQKVIDDSNGEGTTVFCMIETQEGVDKCDEIAKVKGVDVLLVGSNDLSIELGAPGDFQASTFREALGRVSRACKKHGKIMGLAGIYDRPEIHRWAIDDLGIGFMLVQQDVGLITKGAIQTIQALHAVEAK